MKKLVQNWERFALGMARSMYPHLTEDSEIFFEVGSWLEKLVREIMDGQPVNIWMTDEGLQLREELGAETFITFFWIPITSQKQNIKYSSIKLINEVMVVNSVQPFTDFIDGISGAALGLTTEDQNQARRRFPNYYSDAFWGLWHFRQLRSSEDTRDLD